MNKTTKDKFEEMLSILHLVYKVQYDGVRFATVASPAESDKVLSLELEGDSFSVYVDEDNIQVLSLGDDIQTGYCAMDVEDALIRYGGLNHGQIALSVYLYCRLLGILWGTKAPESIWSENPLPDNMTYLEIKGHTEPDGKECLYRYYIRTSGRIIVEKSIEGMPDKVFGFAPSEYLEDPEGIVMRFFDFFKSIGKIESVGKG